MNPRILVVDDDPGMVRTLCDIFRLRGWDAVGVHSGDAAVAAAHDDGFSHVLMDIMMPGIDGVTALKRMKAEQVHATVVLMTAHAADERITEALGVGAVDVVSKPIDFGHLLRLFDAPDGGPFAAVGRH
jgi:DNA-binding response OmpR family regulator